MSFPFASDVTLEKKPRKYLQISNHLVIFKMFLFSKFSQRAYTGCWNLEALHDLKFSAESPGPKKKEIICVQRDSLMHAFFFLTATLTRTFEF